MRQDKLTSKFQTALADAQSLAIGRDNQFMEPAHVMLALIDQQGGTVRPLLMKAGANLNKLRSELMAVLDRLPTVQGTPGEVFGIVGSMGYLEIVANRAAAAQITGAGKGSEVSIFLGEAAAAGKGA